MTRTSVVEVSPMFKDDTLERLRQKTDHHRWVKYLHTNYDLSLAEAEVLAEEVQQEKEAEDTLEDGQQWYQCVHKEERAGKPLEDCRLVRVKLTIRSPEDLDCDTIRQAKKVIAARLCWEALRQDGLLSVEDLARFLVTSPSTIKRMLGELREGGVIVPTRGYYRDIGPGRSHKAEAGKMYLKGARPTRIARLMGHHLNSIERYLRDFTRMWLSSEEGYTAIRTSRNLTLSESLVREYLRLAEEYGDDPDYGSVFDQLRRQYDPRAKKNPTTSGGDE